MTNNKSYSNNELSSDSIMEMATAFHRSRVLFTAYELDIFTVLGDKSKSAIDVARVIETDERSTERLMNALCALGMLIKKDGRFSNTPQALHFLVKGSEGYLGSIMHFVHLWDSWSTLTQAVRKGKSVVPQHIDERGSEWLIAFIAAMHEIAYLQAPDVVSLIDLSDVSKVLDVGGGSGAYSMAFVKAKEGVKATVFDLSNVVHLTNKYIDEEGLSHSIETVIGDYNIDEFGSRFDVVFLSAIIHINSLQENQDLIAKCSKALNPKGQVVIQDFIMNEDRTSPPFGALFSLNMLVGTESGDTYTESEVRMWMEKAGLSDIKRKDTGFNTTLIMGRKIE